VPDIKESGQTFAENTWAITPTTKMGFTGRVGG
jgi:hypothetical protein